MRKTLKDLFLAMLNATLILVALVLFLLVLVLTKVNSLSASFAQNLSVIAPVETDIKTINTEITELKAEIADLRARSQDASHAKLDGLQAKATKIEAQLESIQTSMTTLAETPERLLDHAMTSAADQAVAGVARIKGCVPE